MVYGLNIIRKVLEMSRQDPDRHKDEYNSVYSAFSKLPKEEQERFAKEFEVYDNYMMTHKKGEHNEKLALEEVDRVFGYV